MFLQKWKENSLSYDSWYDLQLCRVQKNFCPFIQEPQIIYKELDKTSLLCWLKDKSAALCGFNLEWERIVVMIIKI